MVEIPRDIANELARAEKVLWAGQPRQGVVLRGPDAFLVPFALVWTGGVAAMGVAMLSAPKVDPMGFVVVPLFLAVGLFILVGRFFVEARQRARTFYAVTNERIVIASGLFSRAVKSIDLKSLGEITLSERRNGTGSIVFGPMSPFDWMYMPAWPGMGQRMAARFELISNVRPVYEAIRSAQRALAT
jgi:hypothetical protein